MAVIQDRRFRTMYILFLPLTLAVSSVFAAKKPDWVSSSETIRRSGSDVIILCEGQGIAKDLAIKSALQQCASLASEQVDGQNTEIKSVIIETEKDPPKLHQEISKNSTITGLRPKIEKDHTERDEDGGYVVTLLVRYDLNSAKLIPIGEPAPKVDDENTSSTLAVDNVLSSPSNSGVKRKNLVQSANRVVSLSVIPKCDDILIRSKSSRTLTCSTMPMTIAIDVSSDREIIIRAKNYLTKTLKINQQRSPATNYDVERIQVQLEPL